jgi:hypothetical protein
MPPLLFTLELDATNLEKLQTLRDRYFDRNIVPAHLSLFHHLPHQSHIIERAANLAKTTTAFPLNFAQIIRLSNGFAVKVESQSNVESLHQQLSASYSQWLTPQDKQKYVPHVTLMNKAPRYEAAIAYAEFSHQWRPWTGVATGILIWEYLGGPWKSVVTIPFLKAN